MSTRILMSTHEYAIQAYSWVVNTNVLMGITISPRRTQRLTFLLSDSFSYSQKCFPTHVKSNVAFPTQRFSFVHTEMFSYSRVSTREYVCRKVAYSSRTQAGVFVYDIVSAKVEGGRRPVEL